MTSKHSQDKERIINALLETNQLLNSNDALYVYYQKASGSLGEICRYLGIQTTNLTALSEAVPVIREMWIYYQPINREMRVAVDRQKDIFEALGREKNADIDIYSHRFAEIRTLLSEMNRAVSISEKLLCYGKESEQIDMDYLNDILPTLKVTLTTFNKNTKELNQIFEQHKNFNIRNLKKPSRS